MELGSTSRMLTSRTQAKGNDCKDIAKHLAMDPMIQKYADVLMQFVEVSWMLDIVDMKSVRKIW